jgi:hypothetical protein
VNIFQKIKSLFEGATDPQRFSVDYYVTTRTDKGSSTRFKLVGRLDQMQGSPRSETAVLGYLRRKHPNTDVQINSLEFID